MSETIGSGASREAQGSGKSRSRSPHCSRKLTPAGPQLISIRYPASCSLRSNSTIARVLACSITSTANPSAGTALRRTTSAPRHWAEIRPPRPVQLLVDASPAPVGAGDGWVKDVLDCRPTRIPALEIVHQMANEAKATVTTQIAATSGTVRRFTSPIMAGGPLSPAGRRSDLAPGARYGGTVSRMANVLIIEDDPAIRRSLGQALVDRGHAVARCATGIEGLARLVETEPSVVLLDLGLPDIDGLRLLPMIRGASTVPVIVITAQDDDALIVRALDAGADDYVVKPFTFEVLLARVRVLLRRSNDKRPIRFSYADLTLDTGAHQARRGARSIPLTNLELRLLREFLQHPDQVLPKEVLLERVWGYDFGGTPNIVEVYVKQLRQKLEDEGEARLIHTIRNAGYILREEA